MVKCFSEDIRIKLTCGSPFSSWQLDWNEGVQMLFEIPHLEGIMAMMNSVYIQCSEYHNFARALCSMLGLDKGAGPNTIISAVNSLLVT